MPRPGDVRWSKCIPSSPPSALAYSPLAADDQYLYFVDTNVNPGFDTLMRCAQAACKPTPIAQLPAASCNGGVVGVNGVAVFWVCNNGNGSNVLRLAK